MRILAIETSCDETGVAVVEGEKTPDGFLFRVLGSALLSQAALHAEYGGVYPNLAKREHEKNLPIILAQALAAAGNPHIDAIAVTVGPGLEPALWTGITFAQKLAQAWQVPLLPANHMEGHLISSLATKTSEHAWELREVSLPVLGLLISGGHTEFILMREWFSYELIGTTLDDAVGEAFDKVARMLGLPYPGGPQISKHAAAARAAAPIEIHHGGKASESKAAPSRALNLPRPMLSSNSCEMSFSGLKTAALYALRDRGGIQMLGEQERAEFAREFEDAVADVLVAKTKRALNTTGAQTFVIGGGVAANSHIRRSLEHVVLREFGEVEFRLPEIGITGDNAVMIAMAALARSLAGAQQTPDPATLRASGNLSLSSHV